MAEVGSNRGDRAWRPRAIHAATSEPRRSGRSIPRTMRVIVLAAAAILCGVAYAQTQTPPSTPTTTPTPTPAATPAAQPKAPAPQSHGPRLRELPREVPPVDLPDGARRQERCAGLDVPDLPWRRDRAPQGSGCRQAAGTTDQQDRDRGREKRRLPDVPLEQPPPGVLGRRGSTRETMSPASIATTSTIRRDRRSWRRTRPRSAPTRRTFAGSATSRCGPPR